MKKKILSTMFCTALCASMLVGCTGSNSGEVITPPSEEVVTEITEPTEEVTTEHIDEPIILDDFKFVDDYVKSDIYSVNNITTILDYLEDSNPDDENTILSETSMNMALSLLLEGSMDGSTTSNDLVKYLSQSNYLPTTNDIRNKNNALITKYIKNDKVTLRLANSIYGNETITFTPYYIKTIESAYNGQSKTLNFLDPNSADIINTWVSDNTNGCIKDMIDSGTLSESDAVLINALYFNGEWESEFDEYGCYTENFNNLNGTTSEITMMHANDVGAYYESDYAEGFMKPYKDNNLVFVGILPKNTGDFLVSELDIDTLLNNPNYDYNVNISVPEFVVEDSNSLFDALKDNGLNNVFDKKNPDFLDVMCDSNMFVSDVIQKTYVDVNRKGTEAAAATEVIMVKATSLEEPKPVKSIDLDRPFVFMIYDTENHECLFMGKINNL